MCRDTLARPRAIPTGLWQPGSSMLLQVCLGLHAAGTIAVTSLPATAQETVLLQVRGQPGDWAEFEHRKELTVQLPADLGGPATTHTRLRLGQRVDSREGDAIAFRSVLREIVFRVEPEPEELPDLTGLQGLEFRYAIDRTGRTIWMAVPGSDEDAGPDLREQLENWLGQLGFPSLPEGPVAVGDEWLQSNPVPATAVGLAFDYDLVEERITRFSELQATDRATIAVLEVRTKWTPSFEPDRAGSPLAALRGISSQTVRFDVQNGRFLGGTGTTALELVLAPPGGNQLVSVEATGYQSTSLTASGHGAP